MSERESGKQEIDQVVGQLLIDQNLGISKTNIKPDYFVDWGYDSLVVKYEKRAYKFYGKGYGGRQVSEKSLNFYKEITNDAKRLAETKKFSFYLSPNLSYPVVINSFDEIITSDKYETLVGVMPFVEGPNLEQAFFAPTLIGTFLGRTNVRIGSELGVAGIDILLYNAKIANNRIVVTDLCSNIKKLRHFGKRKFLLNR